MTSSMETDFTQGHPERSYQHELLIWQQNEIRKLKLTKEWKTRNGMKGDDFNVPLLKSQSPLPPKRLNRREKQDLCKVTSIQFHQVVHLLSTFLGCGAKRFARSSSVGDQNFFRQPHQTNGSPERGMWFFQSMFENKSSLKTELFQPLPREKKSLGGSFLGASGTVRGC